MQNLKNLYSKASQAAEYVAESVSATLTRSTCHLSQINDNIYELHFPVKAELQVTVAREAARILNEKHCGQWMVWNLGAPFTNSEVPAILENQVQEAGKLCTEAPNLEELMTVCLYLRQWLSADNKNVAIVLQPNQPFLEAYSMLLIAGYLMYSGLRRRAVHAISHYQLQRRRSHAATNLDLLVYEEPLCPPLFIRYLQYMETLLRLRIVPNPRGLVLRKVVVSNVPDCNDKHGCNLRLEVIANGERILVSDSKLVVPPFIHSDRSAHFTVERSIEGNLALKLYNIQPSAAATSWLGTSKQNDAARSDLLVRYCLHTSHVNDAEHQVVRLHTTDIERISRSFRVDEETFTIDLELGRVEDFDDTALSQLQVLLHRWWDPCHEYSDNAASNPSPTLTRQSSSGTIVLASPTLTRQSSAVGLALQRFHPALEAISSPDKLEDEAFLPALSHESVLLAPSNIRQVMDMIGWRYAMYNWELLYSSFKHGISLNTMFRLCEERAPSILVVKDSNNALFGAFVHDAWQQSTGYYGRGESFVFTLRPTAEAHQWSKKNNLIQMGKDCIAVGGGDHAAIYIDGDLLRGSSSSCATFDSPCLASQQDFEVVYLEIWALCD